MSRSESALGGGNPAGDCEPSASRAAENGCKDEQEEGDGAPDPGYVNVLAGEEVVSHAAEQEQELHSQCLRQHGAGAEDEKDTGDGGRQEQDCRANHEALMGFRAVAQKIGSGNQSNKRKQPKKLE